MPHQAWFSSVTTGNRGNEDGVMKSWWQVFMCSDCEEKSQQGKARFTKAQAKKSWAIISLSLSSAVSVSFLLEA